MRTLFLFLLLLSSASSFAPRRSLHLGRLPQACLSEHGCSSTHLNAVPTEVAWAVATVAGGTTGTPFVARAISTWYRRINLPKWTPPDRVFAPIWTTLYAIMGVAAARVFKTVGLNSPPMKLWFLHYALNLIWAPVFFGAQRLRLGLLINYSLIATLAAIIPIFYQNNPLSGLLLLPYLVWLLYATKLNDAICKLNPTEKGYNDAMLQADIYELQLKAAEYAGV